MDDQLPGGVIKPQSPQPSGPPAADSFGIPAPQSPMQPPAPQPGAYQAPVFPPLNNQAKKKKLKPLFIALLALILIGGGSAAAYFGYVVPNKPENKLLSALADLVSQNELVSEGTIDVTTPEAPGVAVNFKSESNVSQNQFALSGTVGVSGAQFPYELRYVDKNIYAKVGGLESLSSLGLDETNPASSYLSMLAGVNDKWYVVDRSFWSSFGSETSCVTDLSFAFTDDDISKIKAAYKKHPLFTVKSTSQEDVNGTPTTKYAVEPASDAEAIAFAKELETLSVVEKIKSCLKDAGAESVLDEEITDLDTGGTATGNMAIYLTDDNKVKKIDLEAQDSGSTMKMSTTFTYQAVTVSAPEGAEPIQNLLSDLIGGSLIETQLTALDVERETDIKAMHAQLEAFYAQYGFYPTLSEINDDTVRAAEFVGLDEEAYRDPQGLTYKLAATPAQNVYSYAALPSNCMDCTSYTLTATLSDGTTYTKQSLN